MTIVTSRQQRRQLERDNLRWPVSLQEIPSAAWPPYPASAQKPARVLRSRDFLVQVFTHEDTVRLSVNRTRLRGDGRWDDGISWDDLQRLKAEAGYGNRYAVELYPADAEVVNVGNLRHLWLLPAPPPFAWRPSGAP